MRYQSSLIGNAIQISRPIYDDRRVISGITYVIKHGLQWKDAPKA
jgi:transposase